MLADQDSHIRVSITETACLCGTSPRVSITRRCERFGSCPYLSLRTSTRSRFRRRCAQQPHSDQLREDQSRSCACSTPRAQPRCSARSRRTPRRRSQRAASTSALASTFTSSATRISTARLVLSRASPERNSSSRRLCLRPCESLCVLRACASTAISSRAVDRYAASKAGMLPAGIQDKIDVARAPSDGRRAMNARKAQRAADRRS